MLYSVLCSIHKATGNRPLKLGQFYNFVKFSLFHWLKLSKSMPIAKRNGQEWDFVKIVAKIWKNQKI